MAAASSNIPQTQQAFAAALAVMPAGAASDNPQAAVIKTLQLATRYFKHIVFSTSLGQEDQALTHIIFKENLPITVFTLDTGRLFAESYALLAATTAYYKKPIQLYFPDTAAVETYVRQHGSDGFKKSVALRQECCAIRKLTPLRRALKDFSAELWLSGIRKTQSQTRAKTHAALEFDAALSVSKFHPLYHWSAETLSAFIKAQQLPINPLHARGYPSIGCACCTRAVTAGETARAGRWWWEQGGTRECGLHEVRTTSAKPAAIAVN